ncbi:aminoglycoside phosphotransferase family protein [Crossiella cryophila]|uniref:Streptomycin 6-kinase n=1 Tax=Crossiella cryophila TaxID=43355 RepID=A0A7W7CE19_9PSEU|nr:aminoglycoside phosphotransferase family protein [Crossiella cryophila]MBB4679292.1 streptomycin 6-kinase [Crossiella cryophila]
MTLIEVPPAFAALHQQHDGADGLAWIEALPALVADFLDRWELRLDGDPAHGMASLVLPVRQADDSLAVLKLQRVNEENIGEPVGLRGWDGDGVVRLLRHDEPTCTMLLERLDATRPLTVLPDDEQALTILTDLLGRLVALPAPPELRRLADIAAAMVADTPAAAAQLPDPAEAELVRGYAAAVAEVLDEPGDRLLHWDLHYDNVLAPLPGTDREPWLAIDPKPLAGDPGFDLQPALSNRWADLVATGDPHRALRRRFDLMTERLGLDRERATRWTLGRVLQNCLWDIEDGKLRIDPEQRTIAEALTQYPT